MRAKSICKERTYTNFCIRDIKVFAATVEACKICIPLCVNIKHPKAALLCVECAEIGEALIRFITCNANYTNELQKLFAKICKACRSECSKLQFNETTNVAKLCAISLEKISNSQKNKK